MLTNYANHLCRFVVHEFLARGITTGCLTFIHPDDTTHFGQTPAAAKAANHPVAEIQIRDPVSFYARVATAADIGFAEAFIAGDFLASAEQLLNVFKVLIENRDRGGLKSSRLTFAWVGRWLNGIMHVLNRNSVTGSRRNIAAHYDLSNELFGTFLGESWTYSCGMFDRGFDLDAAQWGKIDRIIEKARLDSQCHVLEIGCGWGEFAIRAAKKTGCRVTGITLSREQLTLGRKRVEAAGVGELVSLELVDYRVLAKRGEAYDRVVSIEMVEAVGHEFLGEYFGVIGKVLKRDGICVMQAITTPEERYDEYRRSADFIQKHIFPGGVCPSLQAMVNGMSGTGLMIEGVENIGVHYATTLREWRRRFERNVAEGIVQKMGLDERFVRKWVYYFCYCEVGFATRTLNTLQLVLSRSHNVATLGAAPVSA